MPVLQYQKAEPGHGPGQAAPLQPAAVSAGPPAGPQLRDLVMMVWRRWKLIAGLVAVVTGLAAVWAAQLPARYSARSAVLVSGEAARTVDVNPIAVGTEVRRDVDETLNTELQVLQSRQLAERVIAAAALANLPDFNPALRAPSAAGKAKSWLGSLIGPSADELAADQPSGDEPSGDDLPAGDLPNGTNSLPPDWQAEQVRIAVIDNYLNALRVTPRSNSLVLNIAFEASEASVAANVANTVADQYIALQIEQKTGITARAQEWLAGRVAELRAELEVAEAAVEEYRAGHGLVETGVNGTLISQQTAQLNAQLVVARADLAERRSRLEQLEVLVRTGEVDNASRILASGVIQDMKTQETLLTRRKAELSSEFGPRHPEIVTIEAELANIRSAIGNEMAQMVENERTEFRIAQARVGALANDLKRLEGEATDAGRSEVQLRALEREAAAARQLFERFLERYKETRDQDDFQQADARVISYADVPNFPSSPNRKLIVAVAFAMSAMLGVLLVLGIEHFDSGFRSSDQIAHELGVPALGLVPSLGCSYRRKNRAEAHVLDQPTSAFAEAFRTLRTSLHLADRGNPPKVIMFTSAVPGEGKTTAAVSLARIAAAMGEKTLLIDSDNRRPRAHEAMELKREPGIVDYLEEEASLWDVIQNDTRSALHFVSAGRLITNSVELWRSEQARHFLEQLGKRYDLIVIDSAPVLAVADARILSSIADATVFVAKWGDTRKEAVRNGIAQVLDAGATLAGVLLSQVNVREHARYGFSDSGYYHSKYSGYYTKS